MFDELMELCPDGVIAVDESGVIREANQAMEALLGYPVAALVGQPVEVLVPDRARGEHRSQRRSFTRSGEQRPMGTAGEIRARHASGEEVPVDVMLRPTSQAGRPMTIAVVRDIRHLVAMRDRLARYADHLTVLNRRLDEFAHTIAHDLKAPLRAMRYHADWLHEELGAQAVGETAESLQRMAALSERMAAMVDGVLEYARVGRQVGRVDEVEMSRLVRGVVELLDVPPDFHIDVEEDMPVFRTCAVPLRQVLANLLGNAVWHHDRPDGRVRMRCEETTGSHYLFSVSDDGPGIPPEDHERIFELFERAVPERSGGTGVGLAIVRKVIESVGGHLELESSQEGSTFRFSWPRVLEPPPGNCPG